MCVCVCVCVFYFFNKFLFLYKFFENARNVLYVEGKCFELISKLMAYFKTYELFSNFQ